MVLDKVSHFLELHFLPLQLDVVTAIWNASIPGAEFRGLWVSGQPPELHRKNVALHAKGERQTKFQRVKVDRKSHPWLGHYWQLLAARRRDHPLKPVMLQYRVTHPRIFGQHILVLVAFLRGTQIQVCRKTGGYKKSLGRVWVWSMNDIQNSWIIK